MQDFWVRFFKDWYLISIAGIFIISVIFYFFLGEKDREKLIFILPFSLITLTVFYENFGLAIVVFPEINQWVYQLFNYPHENNHNLWVYNFFGSHLTSFLFLALIYRYLFSPSKRKTVKGLSLLFICSYLVFQLVGVESLFEQQTYSIFVGYSVVIATCGLYFMELISHPDYMEINPLKAFSFWQVTLILFNYTLVFLLEISHNYIISVSMDLMSSLYLISKITWVLILCSFLVTIMFNTPLFPAKRMSYE